MNRTRISWMVASIAAALTAFGCGHGDSTAGPGGSGSTAGGSGSVAAGIGNSDGGGGASGGGASGSAGSSGATSGGNGGGGTGSASGASGGSGSGGGSGGNDAGSDATSVADAASDVNLADAGPANLTMVQSIPLPGTGRIDHMAIDIAGQRLFVASLVNNSVAVVNVANGAVVHSITGLSNPQGVAYVPRLNQIYIANAIDGTVRIFDGATYMLVGTLTLPSNADNLRYDPVADKVWVGYGGTGAAGIGAIDTTSQKVGTDIKLTVHPESFQLETAGSRIFVNLPTIGEVAALDRATVSVTGHWPTGSLTSNYPMSLDEADHRLLVGFRGPATLGVYNTDTGALATQIAIDGDVDDVFYYAQRKTIFLSCGAGPGGTGPGFLDVVQQVDADHYVRINRIPTGTLARTSFFVAAWARLFVAIPATATQSAEIRVYSAG